MKQTIDITPKGMETKEGQVRIQAALDAKDEAVYQVLRASKSLLEVMKWPEGRQRIAQAIAEYHGWEAGEADETFIQPALEAIQEWEKANEEFLKAVAGK